MTTLDGDWICDQDTTWPDEPAGCFAVWQHCDTCEPFASQAPDNAAGLVPAGTGLNIDDLEGNLWFDRRVELRGKWDVCATCTGSGGGYICGIHDIPDTTNLNLTPGEEPMKTKQLLDWESWKAELVRIADEMDFSDPIVQCGEECWRLAYDDGQSPKEAWDENLSYGDND